jgi:O-antigen ligase
MKKVFYWSILIFTFSIPISSFISTKLLVVVLVLSLIVAVPTKASISGSLRKSWDIILYLLVLVMGLINSIDLETGFRVLETSFSLLALLIILNRIDVYERIVHKIFLSFMVGVLTACIICLVAALIKYNETGSGQVFFYYQLTEVIRSHPTYLAYYLIASITYLIYFTYYDIEKARKAVWIPVSIFFFLMLMLTGGRTSYISLLMVFSFFILKFILEEGTKEKKTVFLLVVILLVSLLGISSINYFRKEFSGQNDYWERISLWKSAIDANPNILIGVGTGDYKTVLNAYYQSHQLAKFAIDSVNSHNQFIQIYFSNGLLGLVSLLILMGRPLYLSTRIQNTLGILLMFPFLTYGITEVFLGRYQGVVFFALIHQLIIHQQYTTKPSISLNAA